MTDKRDFKTDKENRVYANPESVSSLKPFQTDGTFYALDLNAAPLLRAYFVAAILTYHDRDKGAKFDEVLKVLNLEDYSDEKTVTSFESIRQAVVSEAYTISQIIKNYSMWGTDESLKKNPFFVYFVSSMSRLQVSFQVAVALLNSGFFVEVIPIYRLILEQLAFGAYLLTETDPEKIEENNITRNIKHLKELYNKNDEIGRFYHYLSSGAHLDPKEIGKYICLSDEKTLAVKNRSGKECDKETGDLIYLLKTYGDIAFIGQNHFGFTTPDRSYFLDWYNYFCNTVECLNERFKKALSIS